MVKYRCQLAGTDFIFQLSSQNYNKDIITLSRDLFQQRASCYFLAVSELQVCRHDQDVAIYWSYTRDFKQQDRHTNSISKHPHNIIGLYSSELSYIFLLNVSIKVHTLNSVILLNRQEWNVHLLFMFYLPFLLFIHVIDSSFELSNWMTHIENIYI